jgi:hypothetical protein
MDIFEKNQVVVKNSDMGKSDEWRGYVINFGKYKGDTLGIIRINDPKYILWLYENAHSSEVKNVCLVALTHINSTAPQDLKYYE